MDRSNDEREERPLFVIDVSREKRKGGIDKIAAQLLPQNYLDSLPPTD